MSADTLPKRSLPTVILFVATSIVLIGAHSMLTGWILFAATMTSTLFLAAKERDMLLAICLSLAVIVITPANTDISFGHCIKMLSGMVAAVVIPYVIIERWRKYEVIKYKLKHGRRWHVYEILYVLFPATLGYFVVPYFFKTTGLYSHWMVNLSFHGLLLLLIGLVAVGTWDEIIFVATIGSVLRKLLPFWAANIAQASVFSSFLYELGFRSWGAGFAYVFALVQFYIYHKTNSLLYAITVHIVFDVVLFLALIHVYYPQYLRIFITA